MTTIKTNTGLPLAVALEVILYMHEEQDTLLPDWAGIASSVGLPWQTCHALCRVADEFYERRLKDGRGIAGELLAMQEDTGMAVVRP